MPLHLPLPLLLVLVVAVAVQSQTATAPLPPLCSLKCSAHGTCERINPIDQRLARLAFVYEEAQPRQLRQEVRDAGVEYCHCKDGFWGNTCEQSCPVDDRKVACGGDDRHVQSTDIFESCGQVVHVVDASVTGAPGNVTWALPGMCNCRRPFFGSACQFTVTVELNGGAASRLPTWTDFWSAAIAPEVAPNPPLVVRGIATGQKFFPPPANAICSGPATPSTGTATAQGCDCAPGWFPTTLRQPALDSSAVIPHSTNFAPPDADSGTATTAATPPHTWPYSQVPVCSIRAVNRATSLQTPPDVVVVVPSPHPSPSLPLGCSSYCDLETPCPTLAPPVQCYGPYLSLFYCCKHDPFAPPDDGDDDGGGPYHLHPLPPIDVGAVTRFPYGRRMPYDSKADGGGGGISWVVVIVLLILGLLLLCLVTGVGLWYRCDYTPPLTAKRRPSIELTHSATAAEEEEEGEEEEEEEDNAERDVEEQIELELEDDRDD